MTDRPIIFSGPMVRALLEGRKTQTRRVLKPQPWHGKDTWHGDAEECWTDGKCALCDGPPYAIGDRLWCRETWTEGPDGATPVLYKAEADTDGTVPYLVSGTPMGGGVGHAKVDRWRPSIYMPRWASRLTLTVTDVRVERLQDIADKGDGLCRIDDIEAEGLDKIFDPLDDRVDSACAVDWFMDLWNSIHGKHWDRDWDANPWVCALTFTVKEGNIDG